MNKDVAKVDIYRNLNVPKEQLEKWSILDRSTRRVVDITHSALVKNVKFIVQPAGRKRVLEEKRKNVHAFVRGDLIENPWWFALKETLEEDHYLTKVSYNPYKADHFIREDTGEAVYQAGDVWIAPHGVYANKQDVR